MKFYIAHTIIGNPPVASNWITTPASTRHDAMVAADALRRNMGNRGTVWVGSPNADGVIVARYRNRSSAQTQTLWVLV